MHDDITQRQRASGQNCTTGIFPNVQIGCHPEAVFLMRFLPHESDPERFYYDTMTLLLPVDDPDYTPPGWMGLTPTGCQVRPPVHASASMVNLIICSLPSRC